jgi:hypothetical protein
MKRRCIRLLQCFLLFASLDYSLVLSAQKASSRPSTHLSAQPPGKTDVCSMLSSADIQAVQGEPVVESKASPQSSNGVTMSECLFRAATPAKSVSLALALPGKQSPRDFWRKHFHSEDASKSDKPAKPAKARPQNDKKQEKEDEETRPRAIGGVGDVAVWMGSPISGALYVLRGNSFIRVSVGGVREESARIKKSVALAHLALKRIQR